MKVTISWLHEWLPSRISTVQLAEQLTNAGLEVEKLTPIVSAVHRVVVGQIIDCQPHSQDAALQITKVDIGKEVPLTILSNLTDCRRGAKVACAPAGATLPAFPTVDTRLVKGIASEGLLCSYASLGLGKDSVGLIKLPRRASVGADVGDYLALEDTLLEIALTPNRADCLSILGVAREVATLNRLRLCEPELVQVQPTIDETIPVEIKTPEACSRYLAQVVHLESFSTVTPSWMRIRLQHCGLEPTGLAVVDITNYVQLELGQPLHAFDLAKIEREVIVRMARNGEQITLLNGTRVVLRDGTLVIADRKGPLAIAGVMGGIESAVTPFTRKILLEAANFSPTAIAGRAREYGLVTEAAHRFERGVDPTMPRRALDRATQLLQEICGVVVGPIIDRLGVDHLAPPKNIMLRHESITKILGCRIASDLVTTILGSLGGTVELRHEGEWHFTAPPWRVDLQLEVDLVEEIARLYGYNKLPTDPLPGGATMGQHQETVLHPRRIRSLLVDRGYQEVITYSFVDPKSQSLLHPGHDAIPVRNPISANLSELRLSLWPGLLAVLVHNQNHQQQRARLFEMGSRFLPRDGVSQEEVLSGLISGNMHGANWSIPNRSVDFFDLKGDIESLLELTGDPGQFIFKKERHPALHPGQSAAIYCLGKPIGLIGALNPSVQEKLGVNRPVVLFELLVSELLSCRLPRFREFSRMPTSSRDISVTVSEHIPAEDVINLCKEVANDTLIGINLADVYRGGGIAEGHKSLTINLLIQNSARTADESEIAATVSKVVVALQQKFQAYLRD